MKPSLLPGYKPTLVARPLLAVLSAAVKSALGPIQSKVILAVTMTVVCLIVIAVPVRAQTPFYFGAQMLGHRLTEQNQSRLGYGFRGGYTAYLPFISLEGEVNFFPTKATGDLGETQAFFGLKFGKSIGRWGAFVKARPGFIHFGGGAFPTRLTQQTNFALDLGGGIERSLGPKVTMRFDVGDTKIYYGDAGLLSFPGLAGVGRLGTHNTLQSSVGLVLHF